jgi:hypothetical protein
MAKAVLIGSSRLRFICYSKELIGDITLYVWIEWKHGRLANIVQSRVTTANMNFITWNKACCLFPAATIGWRESYMVGDLNEDDDF